MESDFDDNMLNFQDEEDLEGGNNSKCGTCDTCHIELGDYKIDTVEELKIDFQSEISDFHYMLSYMTTITFAKSSSIKKIGKYSFSNCYNLKEVIINDKVEEIGIGAFIHCDALFKFSMLGDSKLTTIDDYAFCGCKRLSRFMFPEKLIKIGKKAFKGTASLNVIDLSLTNVQIIGENAFSRSSVSYLSLPATLKSFGSIKLEFGMLYEIEINYNNPYYLVDKSFIINDSRSMAAFRMAFLPYRVFLREGIQFISPFFALNSWIKFLCIPSTVKEIGRKAFAYCSHIARIRFARNSILKVIRSNAFHACSELKSIKLPDSLEVLEERVFFSCNNLKSVMLTNNSHLKKIGKLCFCFTDITHLSLPPSLAYVDTSPFYGIDSLKSFKLENPCFSQVNGIMLANEGTELIACLPSLTEISIPSTVKVIKRNAYLGLNSKVLRMPTSVEVIEESIMVRNGGKVEEIVFEEPSSLKEIKAFAFSSSGEVSIKLPSSVDIIDINAFSNLNCANITINNSNFTTDEYGNVYSKKPKGIVHIKNIDKMIIDPELEVIYAKVFQNYQGDLILPSTLKRIGDKAFYEASIDTLELPNDIEIGNEVFDECFVEKCKIPQRSNYVGSFPKSGEIEFPLNCGVKISKKVKKINTSTIIIPHSSFPTVAHLKITSEESLSFI